MKTSVNTNDYGIKAGSPIYDKNTSTFYPCLWQWLQNGSFVMLDKNEDFARYICGPEYRGKVENACMKMIGATIELAIEGKGAWRSAGTMSKEALEAVADMKKQFVRHCASRKYDIKSIAVYEFDQMFVVAPVWWLFGCAETPEQHRTNY